MIKKTFFFLCIFINTIFSNPKNENIFFTFKHQFKIGSPIIFNKTLQWLEKPKKNFSTKILFKSNEKKIININVEILIPREGNGILVNANFNLKAQAFNNFILLEFSNLNILLHDEIINNYMKKQETHFVKQQLRNKANNLIDFILNSENEFLNLFDKKK